MNIRLLAKLARWPISAALLVAALRFFRVAGESEILGQFANSLFGMAALIAAVVVIAPAVIPWAATPLLRLLDSVYLPRNWDPPPLDYKLARFYRRRERLDEAVRDTKRSSIITRRN